MSIVISGGGIIGTILAVMLFKLTEGSLEISLIEKCSPYHPDMEEFKRVPSIIAISRMSYSELVKIGIEPILLNYSNTINSIEISEYTKFSKIFIKAQDYQLSELGYVIELHNIRKQLFNFLQKKTTVSVYCPSIIDRIKFEKTHNIVFLNNGTQIFTKLMIAADGSDSILANSCGIQWFRQNYNQTAITTEIVTEISNIHQAFERFTQFGSLALLPVSNNVNFVIWCISSQKKKEVLKWDQNKFSKELQDILGWRLGKILNVGIRNFYDLWLGYAQNHIANRLALVGNAAQNLHPITGQGFNVGLQDVVMLSKIIYKALSNNIDIGDCSMLNLYQKYRRLDQCKAIAVTDGLVRLFSNNCLPLVIARNLVLFCIGYSSFLKKILVNSEYFKE